MLISFLVILLNILASDIFLDSSINFLIDTPPERSFRTTLFLFEMLKCIQYLNNFYYFHDVADAHQIKNQTGLYFLTLQVVGWGYIYSSTKNLVGIINLMEIAEL
jgi:hypothetical protein